MIHGPVVGTFFDVMSGRHIVVAKPSDQPQLWNAYIEGALTSYRRFGVESALDYDRVSDGASTSIFAVAIESDARVVGGLRVQGPYTSVEQAYALREWDGREGTNVLRREILGRLDDGVIEPKAFWADHRASRSELIKAVLARVIVHSLGLMNVRYAVCTAATHAAPRWEANGAVVSKGVTAVAYPDDRYQTVLMWWDREQVFDIIPSKQMLAALMRESAELAENITTASVDLSAVAG